MPLIIPGKELKGGTTGQIALLPAATQSATGTGPVLVASANAPVQSCNLIAAELVVTASVAPATLNVDVEFSLDKGTTWYQLVRFTQVGAVAASTELLYARVNATATASMTPIVGTTIGSGLFILHSAMWDDRFRCQFVVAGTSYTFGVNLYMWGAAQ